MRLMVGLTHFLLCAVVLVALSLSVAQIQVGDAGEDEDTDEDTDIEVLAPEEDDADGLTDSFTVPQAAIVAQSTFDQSTEGWSFYNDATFSWDDFGNPGGALKNVDRVDGRLHGFTASSAFLGDQSAAFGGSLQWDIYISANDGTGADQPDVVLAGNGLGTPFSIYLGQRRGGGSTIT